MIASEAADVLRPLLPSLSEEIVEAIGREVEGYRRPMEGPFGRGVRRGVEQALGQFVQGGADGGSRAVYVALGRGEYRAGRSLESLLGAYRLGARLAWRRVVEAGEEAELDPETLYDVAEAIFAYIDELSAESAHGYAQAQSEAAGERGRRRERLVALLAQDPPADEAVVRTAAEEAGWALPAELTAVVTRDADGGTLAARLGADALAAPGDVDTVALVPDPAGPGRRAGLVSALGETEAAIGPAVPWADAAGSVREARLALRLAATGRLGPERPLLAEEHRLALLLHADESLATDFAARTLAPLHELPEGKRRRLTETLRAWLDHQGRIEDTAHALEVHPQTVRYRLGQLREVLGLELERPDGRLALAVALRVAS